MQQRPTLLSSCALAATAEEARFRIDYPNSTPRASRIVALDGEAASVLDRISEQDWNGARFLAYQEARRGLDHLQPDAILRSFDGAPTLLSEELEGADVAVMIAATARDSEAASIIGRACAARGIMTAGLVVGSNGGLDDAITALRPHASMLVVATDEDYIPEMLTALRA